MTKKSRRILFYFAFIIFLFGSYAAILYAQGYKYSFSEHTFVRTGAINLKANTDAKIFVDDELIGSTSFIGNSFGIDRLLPGEYTIRLQQDGYSSWQKRILVEEGRVSDFSHIILLPESEEESAKLTQEITDAFQSPNIILAARNSRLPSQTASVSSEFSFVIQNGQLRASMNGEVSVLDTNVRGFAVSGSKKKLLWWTSNELWEYWLTDTDYQPLHKKYDQQLITRFVSPIQKAQWFRDEDHVVVNSGGYKVVETDTRGGINIIKI